MAVSQKLVPTLKTGVSLSPLIQTTIALIQKTTIELVEEVRQELNANPALEETPGPDPNVGEAVPVDALKTEAVANDGGADESGDDWGSERWEGYRDEVQWGHGVRLFGRSGQAIPVENIQASSKTLAEHLRSEIGLTIDDIDEIEICNAIIGCLNEEGYLEATLEDVQLIGRGKWSIGDIERGLQSVQRLEPYGLGARNLRECWLLQLQHSSKNDRLAAVLVREYFDEPVGGAAKPRWLFRCDCGYVQFEIKLENYDEFARRLGVSIVEMKDAIEEIRGLDRAPGLTVVPRKIEYVSPDVRVVKEGGAYHAVFIDEGMPRIRVSPSFSTMVQDKQHKKYRQESLGRAKNFIRAIDQRKLTIMKVAESIVQYQQEFMERGDSALRPLILREIADEVGHHESTVSRVVNNKWIETPQGVLPLNHFFPTRIPRREGDDVSSAVVKSRIKELINNEKPGKRLSDAKIHASLSTDGYELARRTVTKYREALGIPVARLRRGWEG